MRKCPSIHVLTIALALAATPAVAEGLFSGNWYLTLGGSGISAPTFEGSKDRKFFFSPIISVGRGGAPRFSSRNDNPSFAIYDTDVLRAGVVGKFVPGRDADTDDALRGLSEVKWGGEVGAFADLYMTDYLRARAEIRQGFRAHDGLVADVALDAFTDMAPDLRVSAGPRMSYATSGYTEAYYGVNATESAASGLSQYDPEGGITSYGAGGAITWDATDKLQVSAFTEYKRLAGPVADSSLVQERGSKNQLMFGLSASYKFGVSFD
ncbi:MipA/OmpV family protein [Rhizobium sp. AAP43]|uniref:MipA/OmpV family protein n=1 Tax=Rhizobium sp. AAP43 TaxID=1523420 RepID=UPI0006B9282F|nr:MipA/OmpV family protein [Rhizobium sp. AAP43]KPF46727.1 scaffolding protein [Rhizobium sp. AAP43]